jgi:hypothetical protein
VASPGAADAACAIGGTGDGTGRPIERGVAMQDDLRDPFAMLDGDARSGNIAHHHEPFVGIVGIDGTWCVGQHEAAPEGDRAAKSHLCFVARGQSRAESERDECDIIRLDAERAAGVRGFEHVGAIAPYANCAAEQVGANIVAGSAGRRVVRSGDAVVEWFEDNRWGGGHIHVCALNACLAMAGTSCRFGS